MVVPAEVESSIMARSACTGQGRTGQDRIGPRRRAADTIVVIGVIGLAEGTSKERAIHHPSLSPSFTGASKSSRSSHRIDVSSVW